MGTLIQDSFTKMVVVMMVKESVRLRPTILILVISKMVLYKTDSKSCSCQSQKESQKLPIFFIQNYK